MKFVLKILLAPVMLGLQVFTVLSGSMEPTYHTGSLIYVKKVDPYTIKERLLNCPSVLTPSVRTPAGAGAILPITAAALR